MLACLVNMCALSHLILGTPCSASSEEEVSVCMYVWWCVCVCVQIYNRDMSGGNSSSGNLPCMRLK